MDNIDDSLELFESTILKSFTSFVPKIRLKAHQSPKCFTSEIRHRIHRTHSIRKNPSPLNSKEEQKLEVLIIKAQQL